MSNNRFQLEQRSIVLNADGEITEGKFCAYCGALTADSVPYCQDCGEYIVDQGPDRSAILTRISRHANNIPETTNSRITGPRQKAGIIARLTDSRFFDIFRSDSRVLPVFYIIVPPLTIFVTILLTIIIVFLFIGH